MSNMSASPHPPKNAIMTLDRPSVTSASPLPVSVLRVPRVPQLLFLVSSSLSVHLLLSFLLLTSPDSISFTFSFVHSFTCFPTSGLFFALNPFLCLFLQCPSLMNFHSLLKLFSIFFHATSPISIDPPSFLPSSCLFSHPLLYPLSFLLPLAGLLISSFFHPDMPQLAETGGGREREKQIKRAASRQSLSSEPVGQQERSCPRSALKSLGVGILQHLGVPEEGRTTNRICPPPPLSGPTCLTPSKPALGDRTG